MKLLTIDTSSQSASCALSEDGMLLGEFFSNVKLTHSQTIMPMVQSLLEQSRVPLGELGAIGVTVGPGSFTGLRIGISAAKGLAHGLKCDCVGVSTLEALAYGLVACDGLVAPVLDARCNQVYTALFEAKDGVLIRLLPDEAITIDQLEERLKNREFYTFLVGDGAQMCYNKLNQSVAGLRLAPSTLRYTRASAAALACERALADGEAVAAEALAPAYLRLPQAERELLAREQTNKQGDGNQ